MYQKSFKTIYRRLNVVFGHLIFVSSLVERLLRKFKRKLSCLFLWWRGVERFLFIVGYCESSKESSVSFLWAKESFSLRNCSSRNSTLFSSRWSAWPVFKCNQGGDVFENFEVYFFYSMVNKITFLKGNLSVFINV